MRCIRYEMIAAALTVGTARANPDANTLAQKVADGHARGFRCDIDKPKILGNREPGFSGPYDN